MRKNNVSFRFSHGLLLLLTCLSMPLWALADEVVVADAGGNELRYTYDSSDGPATLAGVVSLVATDVVVANSVTDGDGNSHVVKAVGNGAFYNKPTITSITFVDALETIANDYYVFYNLPVLKRIVLPGVNYPFLRNPSVASNVIFVVHPDLVDTYQTNDFTKNYRIMAYGSVTEAAVTTTAGSQLQTKVEAAGVNLAYLERLTVSGPLNGTDIELLHSSMPCLQVLDLGQASIVAGGDKYHRWSVSNNGTATTNGSQTWATQNDTIGERMFYNMPMLRRLVLPQGTKAINNYAVSECRLLVEAVLPNGLLAIGNNAFENDGKLSEANLPSTLTTLGEYAFYETAVREVTIPTGVTILERDIYYSCDSLRTVTLHDGITSIGRAAFSECRNLQTISGIPAQVESIGINAFYYADKLTTPIVIPSTCKTIGYQAFYYCQQVPSFTFNEGLETIDYNAFNRCTIAKFSDIPSTVTSIGYQAFNNCDSLTTFTFPAGVKEVSYSILANCDALESVTLADGTTKIGHSAFYGCPKLAVINGLDQPSLTTIEYEAFFNTGLTDVILSDAITTVGHSLFQNCKQLRSVNVPKGLINLPEDYCCQCPLLTTVTMHDGIRILGPGAFGYCPLLTTIDLNDQITEIQYRAFCQDEHLQLSSLPTSLTKIGYEAFSGTKAMTGALTLSSGLKTLENNAFEGSGITAITLPEGITTLSTSIFYNCEQLATVNLPADLIRIPNNTFNGTKALQTIALPENLKEIGYQAFRNSGLTAIDLPDSLQKIEGNAFYNSQLQSLTIPDGVKTVGDYVAYNCKQLRSASLGHNMDYLSNSAFNYFDGCDSLKLLRIYAGTPPAMSYYSATYRKRCVLEVPEGQDSLYRNADYWKEFMEIRTFFTGDVLNPVDYAVMQQLYRNLDGANWKQPWDLTNDHRAMGKWAGVTTEGDYITAIDLREQGLAGVLPDSIFVLSQLKKLNLSHNRISGDLGRALNGFPDEDIAPLTELNLEGNHFTGDLYPLASRLPQLTSLNVSFNWLTEISQPFSNAVLPNGNFSRGYQFIDWETHELDLPQEADTIIVDITLGIPADIPSSTFHLYRHEAGDYALNFSSMSRIYKNKWGDLSSSSTELVKDNDGLWTLPSGNNNYVLQAPKGQVLTYTHTMPWWSPITYLLRFDWQDGDVNADQTVDVGDLQSVIYYTLYDKKANGQMFNFTCADTNVDGAINVLDMIGTVDLILAYEEPAPARAATASDFTVGNDNTLFCDDSAVVLANNDEVAAIQLFVSGATSAQLHLAADIEGRFSVAKRNVAGGVRLIIYSPAGRTLAPGRHQLLSDLPAGATVGSIRITDPQACRLGVAISNAPTAIDELIVNSKLSNCKYFDLNGRPLSAQWDNLPAGVYIIQVNGKQFKVKK